ncbi:hypothetical protein [Hymenobacter cellulosilyticus]|uniref:Uncharacterized protein n=1 Tax=Hymenobacter cellulosilyticus TaxID=2932248 RepID=A0A8T9Q115_9BACT|nr:hypothetical protein [Hymenobacter cellulosilyticus]UOQ70582.1 hypothetical protein MUN79_17930 [Hymenobacter cellulosilyticus]
MPAASSRLLPLPVEGSRYAVRLLAEPGPAVAAPALPLAFEPYLYLRPEHQELQRFPGEQLTFSLEDHTRQHTVAQLHVAADTAAGQGYSPWQAPFGAVQMAAGLPGPVLRAFLEAAHAELAARGLARLRLRSHPFAYDPAASALLTHTLQQLGYSVALAEINHHLPLEADFRQRLHPSERRRLRKCQQQGFVFEQETPLYLPLAYEFLSRCRQEKGQTLSLSLERLQELFRRFPQDHFLFSVRTPAGEWAALTIAIRVSAGVLYNFYPASPLAYNTFSPVVLLNEGLHAFGRANGQQLLDLGTSTLTEGLNSSLLQFKRHLGGVPSLRLTFER